MNFLQTQINSVANRITNIEYDPYPATYSMFDQNAHNINGTGTAGPGNYTQVTNFNFYLHKPGMMLILTYNTFDPKNKTIAIILRMAYLYTNSL